ncbi:hypothetical protein WA158_001463 [Blastocystis sp. Blastoise]
MNLLLLCIFCFVVTHASRCGQYEHSCSSIGTRNYLKTVVTLFAIDESDHIHQVNITETTCVDHSCRFPMLEIRKTMIGRWIGHDIEDDQTEVYLLRMIESSVIIHDNNTLYDQGVYCVPHVTNNIIYDISDVNCYFGSIHLFQGLQSQLDVNNKYLYKFTQNKVIIDGISYSKHNQEGCFINPIPTDTPCILFLNYNYVGIGIAVFFFIFALIYWISKDYHKPRIDKEDIIY